MVSPPNKSSPVFWLTVVGALLLVAVWFGTDRTPACGSDFSAFYTGARAAAAGDVYNQEHIHQQQRELVGCADTFNWYIRLPYFAGWMQPLARLPYPTALLIWKALLAAAVVGFIWLWQPDRRRAALLAV